MGKLRSPFWLTEVKWACIKSKILEHLKAILFLTQWLRNLILVEANQIKDGVKCSNIHTTWAYQPSKANRAENYRLMDYPASPTGKHSPFLISLFARESLEALHFLKDTRLWYIDYSVLQIRRANKIAHNCIHLSPVTTCINVIIERSLGHVLARPGQELYISLLAKPTDDWRQ